MADLPDMQWLLSEARHRWLRADEISQVLLNHQMLLNHLALTISEEPPRLLPCSGSVFFYDRRVTRYFRRDGLEWKKREDGRTINEAHEKLKVGDVYMLNCYYAKGKENPSFQRRCYSMLQPNLMHIVFVHYLDVKTTCRSSSSASPKVLLDLSSSSSSSSSLLGLEPYGRNEIFKRTLHNSTPGKRFKFSSSFYGHQSEKPPWDEGQLQLETCQYSFRNAISESPSEKGYFNHLLADVLNLETDGFAFHDGADPLQNDKMPLIGCLLQVSSVSDTPSAENFDSHNTFASKYMSILEHPSYASGSDDHGFQDTGASGLGSSTSMRILAETPDPHFCNIDFSSEIDGEDFFPSPFAGLHQSSTSDDLRIDEVLSGHSLWMARRRWTKVCGVMKFWAVWKAAALKRSFTLHQS